MRPRSRPPARRAAPARRQPAWSGYAEGDYVYVAAPLAGTLASLQVQSGQQVARGDALFALEAQSEEAARAEAQARLAAARFQAANTDKGKRPRSSPCRRRSWRRRARRWRWLLQRDFSPQGGRRGHLAPSRAPTTTPHERRWSRPART
jgi:multidrug efflux pump subunit AcrA (membrane-fusion protein)